MPYTTLARVGRSIADVVTSHRADASAGGYGSHAPVEALADEPYRCPLCGRRSIADEPCCGVPMIDDRHPHRRVREWPLRRAHRMPLMGLRARARAGELMDAWALRRALKRPPIVTSIASAAEGTVRIEGTIELQHAVESPDGTACAAYAHRERAVQGCPCRPDCRRRSAWLRLESDVGLFVVNDDTGRALVGHEGFPYLVASHDTRITHGARVVVVGPAAWSRAEAVAHGYRDGFAPLLVFGPSVDAPCVIASAGT